MSPERFERINNMLANRQPDLTVCLEMVHKSHNLAAIVRTADAVGVNQIHTIWPAKSMRLSAHTATGSQKWVDVNIHQNITDAVSQLKKGGMQIVVTNLSSSAKDYREIDYTKPTAILMGQEKYGISKEAIEAADHQVIVPMSGMAQSLNVSVATAVILYEAQRQRLEANMYGTCKIDDATCQKVLFEGGYPIFAKACKRKKIPYPRINEDGEINASEEWWQKVQTY